MKKKSKIFGLRYLEKREVKPSGGINLVPKIPKLSFSTFEYESNQSYVLNSEGDDYILIIQYDYEQCFDAQIFNGVYSPWCCPSTY